MKNKKMREKHLHVLTESAVGSIPGFHLGDGGDGERAIP